LDLELGGRRAVVTGATRGLGRAIAARLIAEDARVAICARDADAVEQAVAELGAAHGAPVDVTDDAALEGFVGAAADALGGGLDLLVANAGGAAGGPDLADADAGDWRTTLDLNVVHAAVAARAAAPLMPPGSAMLFVASISGFRPQPRPQYAAAKAAEIHLAVALARELGPAGIRVNALSPGSIMFPGGSWERRRESDPGAFQAWLDAELPFGRLGSAEEVADAAAFLLSARASWISGTNVVVDGAQNAPSMGGF
jgi:3-oxoacyl-[acyl-carrier protein] reductase